MTDNSLSAVARQIARTEIKVLESDLLAHYSAQVHNLPPATPPVSSANLPKWTTKAALLTETKDDGWVDVHLAYRLAQARIVPMQNVSVEQEGATFLSTLSQTLRLWQDRLSLALDARFTWRYCGEDGRLFLYMIVTIEAPEVQMAQTAAEGFSRVLLHHLPMSEIYQFEPVENERHLTAILGPNSMRSAALLQKREEMVTLLQRKLYVTRPIDGTFYTFHDVMRYLVQSDGMSMVDITVRPSYLTLEEHEHIQQMLNYDVLPDAWDTSFIRTGALSRGHAQFLELTEMYHNRVEQLKTEAYEVRIRVAAAQEADIAPLAMLVGRTLLGVGNFDVTPTTFEEAAESGGQLTDPAPRTIAPPELKRLRHLFTRTEAGMVSRLPRTTGGLPGVPRLSLRYTAIPSDLPEHGCVVGEALGHQHAEALVKLTYADRARHVYVVGRTGTGKTTLLQNLALQDIEQGHGIAIIDPHGDLIEAMLARIPPERAPDVLLFNPGDVARPMGINLLDVEGVVAKNMAVADFIALMYSMYDPNHLGIVGPRFEQAVRSAMQTTMHIKGMTLIDVLRVIADSKYGKSVREHVRDVVLENYWKTVFENQSDFHRSEVLDYITSKFSRFVTDPIVRHIVGQSRTTLNFADVVNNRKILLVNLAKGRLGALNSHFLGFILVARLLISFFERTQQSVADRVPFYLYIDEFQNFSASGLETMLSEGRKYGLGLVLANQYMVQLSESMREAVTSNVGTICAFQVGLRDADHLVREMHPVFTVDDLVNLPAYHVAIKMMNNGQSLMPFTLKTFPEHRTAHQEMAEVIRQYSRYCYGRSASLVSDEIRDQFERSLQERLKSRGSVG
ncbi:MAG: type IV secretory system conjugative DNA transfer family protein [Chloroflexi bacterium]|nr:type IV secretory system conjugative DNA transfer family protein [Chloroflexota bacterium]